MRLEIKCGAAESLGHEFFGGWVRIGGRRLLFGCCVVGAV